MTSAGMLVLVYEIAFNAEVIWRFRLAEAGIALISLTAAILAGRHFRLAASLFLIALIVLAIGIPLQAGRSPGVHYLLLTMGPLAPILFGARRIWQTILAAVFGAFTFLTIEYTVPTFVALNTEWLPQFRVPFRESLDIDYSDTLFIIIITVVEAFLATSTFAALRAAENAEIALDREYARSEMLLLNLLPRPIASRLKDKPDEVIADRFDLVTVLFADIVDFTPRAASHKPDEIIAFLQRIFGEFDRLAEQFGLEKIKTIGDAYMVAGGLPVDRADHTAAVAEMALAMIEVSERLTAELGEDVSVRIGMHAGPAIAGVIGRQKPFYDVWGDTINVASRLEFERLAWANPDYP